MGTTTTYVLLQSEYAYPNDVDVAKSRLLQSRERLLICHNKLVKALTSVGADVSDENARTSEAVTNFDVCIDDAACWLSAARSAGGDSALDRRRSVQSNDLPESGDVGQVNSVQGDGELDQASRDSPSEASLEQRGQPRSPPGTRGSMVPRPPPLPPLPHQVERQEDIPPRTNSGASGGAKKGTSSHIKETDNGHSSSLTGDQTMQMLSVLMKKVDQLTSDDHEERLLRTINDMSGRLESRLARQEATISSLQRELTEIRGRRETSAPGTPRQSRTQTRQVQFMAEPRNQSCPPLPNARGGPIRGRPAGYAQNIQRPSQTFTGVDDMHGANLYQSRYSNDDQNDIFMSGINVNRRNLVSTPHAYAMPIPIHHNVSAIPCFDAGDGSDRGRQFTSGHSESGRCDVRGLGADESERVHEGSMFQLFLNESRRHHQSMVAAITASQSSLEPFDGDPLSFSSFINAFDELYDMPVKV